MTDYSQKRAGFGPLFFFAAPHAVVPGTGYSVGNFAMALEVDHAFIGCVPGAPEGDALLALGFAEGPGNTHPGQGTANRRFFFENFMLELLWVADPAEASSAQTRRTRLWERCGQRDSGTSPFGIVFRRSEDAESAAPFATWAYCPSYLPAGMAMQFATGTSLQEPELICLPFLRRSGAGAPAGAHAAPLRRICGLRVGVPKMRELSAAARLVMQAGWVKYVESAAPLLEILCASPPELLIDLRPALPLMFRGVA